MHLSTDELFDKISLLQGNLKISQEQRLKAPDDKRKKIYEQIKADIEKLQYNLPPLDECKKLGYDKDESIKRLTDLLSDFYIFLKGEMEKSTYLDANVEVAIAWACTESTKLRWEISSISGKSKHSEERIIIL